jgi:hypothetical protein
VFHGPALLPATLLPNSSVLLAWVAGPLARQGWRAPGGWRLRVAEDQSTGRTLLEADIGPEGAVALPGLAPGSLYTVELLPLGPALPPGLGATVCSLAVLPPPAAAGMAGSTSPPGGPGSVVLGLAGLRAHVMWAGGLAVTWAAPAGAQGTVGFRLLLTVAGTGDNSSRCGVN